MNARVLGLLDAGGAPVFDGEELVMWWQQHGRLGRRSVVSLIDWAEQFGEIAELERSFDASIRRRSALRLSWSFDFGPLPASFHISGPALHETPAPLHGEGGSLHAGSDSFRLAGAASPGPSVQLSPAGIGHCPAGGGDSR